MPNRIAWLIISVSAPNGRYTGIVRCGDRSIEIQDRLTVAEAEKINSGLSGGYYQPGSYCPYFSDITDLTRIAKAQYRKWFLGARVLIQGDPELEQPHYVIDMASEETMRKMNYLAQVAETMRPEDVRPLAKEWGRLLLGALKGEG